MTTSSLGQLLIVDDEPINVEILVGIFEDDYDLIVATEGTQAIALAGSVHPDLILLDVMMPGMNGYEVCLHLKEDANTKSIPVIFVTGLGEEHAEARGFDTGAVDYVTKPITPAIVRRRVASQIELKKARDHLATLAKTLEHKNNELLLLRERDRDDMIITNHVMNHIMHSDGLHDQDVQYYQRPAQQFNGDFITAHRDDHGDLRIMLADVTGHGLQAAVFLLPIFRIFRTMVKKGLLTSRIVAEINNTIREIHVSGRFIAAAVAHISRRHSSIEVWNGGIATAFYVQNNGEIHSFRSQHLPLGLADTIDRTTEIIHTEQGALVLCSDGLTEAENPAGEPIGEAWLQTVLRGSPQDKLLDNLLSGLDAHLAGKAAHDDVSILIASVYN